MSIVHPIKLVLLAVFLLGMLLCFIGVRRSKTLKDNHYQPVWRADGGRNGFLITGVVVMVASIVLSFIM